MLIFIGFELYKAHTGDRQGGQSSSSRPYGVEVALQGTLPGYHTSEYEWVSERGHMNIPWLFFVDSIMHVRYFCGLAQSTKFCTH